jgi:CMP-N,N'-diacetyllegionaminic acid synthase
MEHCNLIIIPARGGSKGLKNKNKLILGGIPLILWSIRHAKNCFSGFEIIVTTDDSDIIDLCEKNKINFLRRSEKLSSDNAMMVDVLADALNFYERTNNKRVDNILLLQPTFPFRSENDSYKLIELIKISNFDTIISVIKVNDTHPARMYTISESYLIAYEEKYIDLNRQDLPHVYLRNGAYYCFKSQLIRKGKLYGNKLVPFVMDAEYKVNIDDKMDFLLAQTIYNEIFKS